MALSICILVMISECIVLFAAPGVHAEQRKWWKLSCYAYRDVNRNGIFDMGDRPYGAMPVEMTHPDGNKTVIPSNIAGFANFVVKLGDPDNADLIEPGDYEARGYPPPGWKLTSDLKVQTLTLERIAGAPGGMFVTETCVPIGVAPILKITGAFSPKKDSELGDYKLSIADGQGKTYDLPFDIEGNFEFVGYPGSWTLTFEGGKNNVKYTRAATLSDAAVVLAHIDLDSPPGQQGGGEINTLEFDDLTVSDSLFEIPSGYGGLNWRNWISAHNRFYKGSGYVNATVSSEYVAYNSSGTPGVVWSEKPFDFIGVYLGAAWPRGAEKDVVIKAWKDDRLVHEDRLRISRAGPVYFSANYTAITMLEINSEIYARIAIDNMSVRK
ncbi:MAG: hypothetical protein GY789_22260 [Hyphomicrobiales bacterium]|nr:hypothetical protein [Hyphomicrobiales bacterium]MCP5000178.1 hypothetical protein [Hyphomicrobiales bacterium]